MDAVRTLFDVPRVQVGGLPIMVIDRPTGARLVVETALARRGARGGLPIFLTSANGNVVARYARDPQFRALIDTADGIDADGQPLVIASKYMTPTPIPERSATTDVFHDIARAGAPHGLRVYLLGGHEEINAAAAAELLRRYPGTVLAGRRSGYFWRFEETAIVEAINACRPDVLWVGLGVPREHAFVVRNRARLTRVGLVKTCGGLFDFVAGKSSRAPQWMQDHALEWLYRLWLEPRRLFWRYLTTNVASVVLLALKTGGAVRRRPASRADKAFTTAANRAPESAPVGV